MNTQKKFIETKTGKTNYIKWESKGKQAHILNANGFCAGVYNSLASYLKNDLDIIGSEIKGHGDSDHPINKNFTRWETFSDDLCHVIKETRDTPIIGIGHSMGGIITAMAAASQPELFEKLILIDPVIFKPRTMLIIKIANFFKLQKKFPLYKKAIRRKKDFKSKNEVLNRFMSGRGIFKTWKKEIIEDYVNYCLKENKDKSYSLKCKPETEAQFFTSLPTYSWKILKKVKCPIVVIQGTNSDIFLNDAANYMKKNIKNITIEEIEASHFIPMEKPEELAKLIIKHI